MDNEFITLDEICERISKQIFEMTGKELEKFCNDNFDLVVQQEDEKFLILEN